MMQTAFAHLYHLIFNLLYPFVLSFFASKKYRRMTVSDKFIFYHPSIHSTSLKLRRVLRTNGKGNNIKRDYKKVCFLLVMFVTFSALPICSQHFQYDKAADLLKQNKWDEAYNMLIPLVIDNPDRADVLYDTGVAAYNKDKYAQALAYFLRAATNADNNTLKINAYFNAGNTCIPLKELRQAITYYDEVLSIDSQNEYALHNKKCVEEMLKRQEQQKDQQNQKDQDQKQDQDKQQEQNNNNSDQQNNDQKDQDKNQQNQQQGNDQHNSGNDSQNNDSNDQNQGKDQDNKQKNGDNSQQSSSDQSQKNSDQQKRSDGSDSSKGETGKNQGDEQKESKNTDNNKERNRDQKSQNASDKIKNEKEGQQGQDHNNVPEKQDKKSDEHNSTAALDENKDKEDATGNKQQGYGSSTGQGEEEIKQALNQQLQDPWLVNILQQQEDRDKATNKQLMEAKIRQSGGKNVQNCW